MNDLLIQNKKYTWFTFSEDDSRWNLQGKTLVVTPYMPNECEQEIEKLKSIYGELPIDFEWGYLF